MKMQKDCSRHVWTIIPNLSPAGKIHQNKVYLYGISKPGEMKKPLIFLLGAGITLSCHKDELSSSNGWDWFGTHDNDVYNYVLISANQVTNKADTNDYQISVEAAFIDSSTNRLSGVSDLTVNDRSVLRANDSTYSFGYNNSPYFQEGLSLFGTNVNISIKGNSAEDSVSRTVYLPKKIVRLINDFPEQIDLSKPLQLQWAADEMNPWRKVIIQVYYYPNYSQANDPSLPNSIKPLQYNAPDSGSFTVPVSDLQRFPIKSVIGISIARGTQNTAVLPLSRKRVYIFSSSSASTTPLQVIASKAS
jgi:hypothetical protein